MKAAAASLLGVLLAQATPACTLHETDGAVVQQGAVQLAWKTEPSTLANGQPFKLFVRLCPSDAQLLRVDATMPEHRHGMNYKPTVHALGAGRWRVEGMLWHMAGRWELRWDVRTGARNDVLRTSVVLR